MAHRVPALDQPCSAERGVETRSTTSAARGFAQKSRYFLGLGVLSLSSWACQAVLGGGTDSSAEDEGVTEDRELPGLSPRAFRLTHAQWENSIRDLFGFEDARAWRAQLRRDPRQGGFLFEGNAEVLNVDQALWGAYQRVALDIASRVTKDTVMLARIAPASPGESEEERALEFIEHFGLRVHRRPLDRDQRDAYLELYRAGRTSYEDQSGFAAGTRLVLEAMLQSPYFLYRIEQSSEVREGTIVLDAYEKATRLSYFFWGSLPDAALFRAASSGELDQTEGVRAQIVRLLDDPRARRVIEEYWGIVLDTERFARISPSELAFPSAPSRARLHAAALEETRLFVNAVLVEERGGLKELFLSQVSHVNQDLASIYGISGTFGEEFTRVQLDLSVRSGFLTQVGFLASHATSMDPDPIHRGVFIAKRLSCLKIAAPPDAVPPLPDPGNKSNRQLVTEHTEAAGSSCRSCHTTWINPYGFAFENYDAIGGYRTEDRGHPVDSAVSAWVGGEQRDIEDAVDLSKRLAESQEVHECLAGYLLEFALGRPKAKQDELFLSRVAQASLGDELSFRDMMIELASSRIFLERALDEEAEK